jgi:PAS domain S-box-containing protein
MQNILDHLKCGVFALTIESNPLPNAVDEMGLTSLTAKFAIANLEFQHLLFGETQNQQAINLLGLEPQQCLPSEFAQLLQTHIQECWQTKACVEFETKRNLESHGLLSISLSPELDCDDNLRQIIGTCQHIGEKALSKSQLRDFNHKKFSQLISEVSDAFVVVDHEGVVRYINQSAEDLFGCSAEELVGETFGLPVVAGQSTDIDILNRGSTTSAEMRVSHAIDADRRVYVVASLRDVSERKRVEESLQLRERAIAASSNGIVITDATQPNNPMIYVNPSFERITGYSAAEVLGHDCRFLQGGDRNQIGLLDLRRAIEQQKECHAVLLNYRKDGTPFWNDLYIAPVFNEHGDLTNYIGIQTDITDQVKSTQRLLESEERLRTVLTSIKEGITFSDDSGYFSIFNAGMENLTGYTISEANASPDFTTFLYPDPDEHGKALQRLQHLQETGTTITVETRIQHRDGIFKDVLVSTRMMSYKGKRMYLSSYYDISDRKKVETQLRYQNERERLLNAILLKIQRELNLDQVLSITVQEAQALLRIDRVVIYQFQEDWSGKFVVEAVNNPELSILGKTISDSCFNQDNIHRYQNRAISSITDVDTADLTPCHKELLQSFQVKANIVAAISFGDTLWGLLIAHQCFAPRQWEEFEIDLLRQLANHVAIAIQQVRLFERVQDLNKNLERQVADRTHQLEQSLSQLERALLKEKELNELKSQFISRASHEFRTPLATIQTASDLLRNYSHKMSEDKKLERIDKIQREVKGMTNLLEEVLIIGKTESGKFELCLEEIRLEDFCLEIIEQTKLLGNGKHQVVFKNINAPIKILIDTKFFRQLISNLLSNAIKYSPNASQVNFTVAQTNERTPKLLLEFEDKGIGIPLGDQEKIFEHFYRAHNVGMIVGTGLGMAIIKNSVDILGGTIQLISTENKGTTVKVKLPIYLKG